jgi:uncharacterized membrane protein
MKPTRNLHANVNDLERLASVMIGTTLVALGLRGRGPLGRTASITTGIGLIGRGATGYCPMNAALGRTRMRDDTTVALSGSRGVRVEETVVIEAPVARLYSLWRDATKLPVLLDHVSRVERIDDTATHWEVSGPGGVKLEWDAEIINAVHNELIGWRSLPGADVASAGSVRFDDLGGGRTRLTVTMQYNAPFGKASDALARLIGQSPSALLRQDLSRLKYRIEGGHVAFAGVSAAVPAAARPAQFVPSI